MITINNTRFYVNDRNILNTVIRHNEIKNRIIANKYNAKNFQEIANYEYRKLDLIKPYSKRIDENTYDKIDNIVRSHKDYIKNLNRDDRDDRDDSENIVDIRKNIDYQLRLLQDDQDIKELSNKVKVF